MIVKLLWPRSDLKSKVSLPMKAKPPCNIYPSLHVTLLLVPFEFLSQLPIFIFQNFDLAL
jgi:hypothetical protein